MLREVRRAVFRLHKALIDAERAGLERQAGPVPSGVFLQSLLHDPELAWLKPFSGLIVEMDEALAQPEPHSEAGARAFIDRVHNLVASADEPDDSGVSSRYGDASRKDPDVLLAHIELMSRITDAGAEPDDP
ncbi:hypothetical protein BH23GEM8_BH23GEM8_12520 [soil metagenome]